MKINLIIVFFCIVAIVPLVNAQSIEWVKQYSGTDYKYSSSLVTDKWGNIYTIGSFQGTVDFDPSVDTFELKSVGISDMFISKLDSSGNFLWAKQFSSSGTIDGNSITIDLAGNVYATGSFFKTVDFNPSTETFNLTSKKWGDVFVLKLDGNGNFIWARQLRGTQNTFGRSIKVDRFTNVYITGDFEGTVDFDPTESVFSLTSKGNEDSFICKLDTSGNFEWAKQIEGEQNVRARAIAIDTSKNVYLIGTFKGKVDFDPSEHFFNLTSKGFDDIFISKLDASGNFVWAKQVGSSSDDIGYSIDVDKSGNIYTTGSFKGILEIALNSKIINLASKGLSDVFVAKLDKFGNFIWAKQIGGIASDEGISIAVDNLENAYITGLFRQTVDFEHVSDTFSLKSLGFTDVFISKFDQQGNMVWTRQFGGTGIDIGKTIIVDSLKNIYLIGEFNSSIKFDLEGGSINLTSVGGTDIFILKKAIE